jgi:hypothetical protein
MAWVKMPVILGGIAGDGFSNGEPGVFLGIFSVVTGTVDETAANTTEEEVFTVAGLKAGDIVVAVNKPSEQAGLGITNARVSTTDTLALSYMNTTAAGIVPADETYLVLIFRING